jgi:protein-tyrosine phosphatase
MACCSSRRIVASLNRVLFICTGNYYRSRFAELLFKAAAHERGLQWDATSRGTDVLGAGRYNVGPISIVARHALVALGVQVEESPRSPEQLSEHDLADADLIVAVCEAEHRPYLERAFPTAAARVEYWNVNDLADTTADEALPALEQRVRELVAGLATSS